MGCTRGFFLWRRNPALPFSQKFCCSQTDPTGQGADRNGRSWKGLVGSWHSLWKGSGTVVFTVFPTQSILWPIQENDAMIDKGTCINPRGGEDTEGRAGVVSYWKELAGLVFFVKYGCQTFIVSFGTPVNNFIQWLTNPYSKTSSVQFLGGKSFHTDWAQPGSCELCHISRQGLVGGSCARATSGTSVMSNLAQNHTYWPGKTGRKHSN